MANRQSVPGAGLGGAMLKTGIKNTPIPVEVERVVPENNTLGMIADAAEGAKNALAFMEKYKKNQATYEADQLLQHNRAQLQNASSAEEFEQVANSIEDSMKSYFSDDAVKKDFWLNNGDRLLNAHRLDVARIKEQKDFDFGRESLNNSLAENQKILATASGDKGRLLLDSGLTDIAATPFLSDEDKEIYRSGFVRNGILNLALNDPDTAMAYADKYVPAEKGRDELKQHLAEAKNLREAALQKVAAEQQRVDDINEYGKQLSFWAERERGNINDAEFYVLTAEGNDGALAKASEAKAATPLKTTYALIKKLSQGETLSAEETRDAGLALVSAYKQNKIGLEEAVDWQNKVLAAAADKSLAAKYFDKNAYALADKVFLPDIDVRAGDTAAEEFMEKKAQLMFEINDVYNAKREALTNVFTEKGGQLTPAYERRFNQQALRETREELGLMENVDSNLDFGTLRRMMKNFYTGSDENAVWQRFYNEAPYADDKKALFKKIAEEEERRELFYPQFDTFAEVEAANLAKGEKFYLRGRLAVKS